MLTKRNLLYFNSFLFICLLALTFYFVKGASLFAEPIPSYDISSFSDLKNLKSSGIFKLDDSNKIPIDENGYNVFELKEPVIFNVTGELKSSSDYKYKIIGAVDTDGNPTTIFKQASDVQLFNVINSAILENVILDGSEIIDGTKSAIYVKNITNSLELTNVIIKDFESSDYGGAICCNGILNISNSKFDNNSALKQGGAIQLNGNGIITAEDCIFTRNKAISNTDSVYGGAICISSNCTNTNTFTRCYFGLEDDDESGNYIYSQTKGPYGGAIYLGENSTLDECYFYHNYVSSDSTNAEFTAEGGALCISGTSCTIENSVFKNNSTKGQNLFQFGGAASLYGNVSINNTLFDNNTSINGGALCVSENVQMNLEDCIFTRNKVISDIAPTFGGAIAIDILNTNVNTLKRCYFGLENDNESGNFAYSSSEGALGGAIQLGPQSILEECYFYHNYCLDTNALVYGGAITSSSKNILCHIKESIFKDNYVIGCNASGGAIYIESYDADTDFAIDNCIFDNNYCEAGVKGCGGAIYNCVILFLSNNEFNNNYCKINTDIEPDGFDESAVRALGGAICNDAMININNVQGVNNKAEYGGFIYSPSFTYLSGDINVPYEVNNNEIINEVMIIADNTDVPYMYLYSSSQDGLNTYPFEYVSTNDKIGLSYFSMNPGEWVATSSNDINYNDVFDLIKYNVNDDLEVSKELVDSNDYKFVNKQNSSNYEVYLARNVNSYDTSKLDDVNYDGTNVPASITFSGSNLNYYYSTLNYGFHVYQQYILNQTPPYNTINSLEDFINYFKTMILPANVTLDSDNSNVTYKNNDKAGRATAVIEGKTDADNNAFLFGTVNIPYDIVCDITSAAADPHIIVDENGDLRLYAAGNIIDSDVTFSNMVNTGSGITYDVECGSSYDTENGDFYKGTKTSVLTKNINYIENDNDGNNDISVDASNRLYKVIDINVSDIITNADSSEIKLNISNKDKNNISSDLTGATKTSYDALKDNKTELGYFDINVTRTDEKDGSPINKGKQSLFTDKTLTLNLKVDKPSDKKYKNYKLLHVHDDGTIDDTNAVVTEEDNKLNFKFTIGDFSNFILLADIDNSGNGSGTGGGSNNTDKPVRTQTITVQIIDHKSIIKGYEDGTFRPQRNITREEIATLFARLSNDYNENVDYTHFISDMGCIDEPLTYWSANYVGYMLSKGYMELEGNKFYPQRYLTRKELVKIICLFKNYEIVNTNSSFKDAYGDKYIATLESKNFVEGYPDGTFKPNNNITRAELSKVIVIMEDRLIKDPTRVNDGLRRELVSKYNDLDKDAWYMPYVFEISYDHSKNLVH